MDGSLVKNLDIFKRLTGKADIRNVVVTTTMWNEVDEEVGTRREKELESDLKSEVVDNGGRIARFQDTHDSAWNIIDGGFGVVSRQDEQQATQLDSPVEAVYCWNAWL